MAEISEHCPGVKVVLCALKCDLREEQEKDDDDHHQQPGPGMIQYNEGLEVARRIGALRYLGMRSLSRFDVLLTIRARMLSDAQSRCQRSFHRSSPSRPPGQTCSIERRQQVCHHVITSHPTKPAFNRDTLPHVPLNLPYALHNHPRLNAYTTPRI